MAGLLVVGGADVLVTTTVADLFLALTGSADGGVVVGGVKGSTLGWGGGKIPLE